MKIINMVKEIKEIHKEDIVFIKIGNFYHCYGKDSYIISYLFEYKIKPIKNTNITTVGFPIQSLNKILSELESKKINYILLDRRHNYESDLFSDNKNLNAYIKYYNYARIYINYKKRIDNIKNFLIENVQNKEFNHILK